MRKRIFMAMSIAILLCLGCWCRMTVCWAQAEAASASSTPEAPQPLSTPVSPEESPDAADSGAVLLIENENTFAGMDRPYAQGYMPLMEEDTARVVLPLEPADLQRAPANIQVGVNLGDPETAPFVFQNYDMTVPLKPCRPQGEETGEQEIYLIDLALPLQPEHDAGRYPVTFVCSGSTAAGRSFEQSFTVFVTTEGAAAPEPEPGTGPDDGGSGDAGYSGGGDGGGASAPSAEPTPTLQPKLLVTSYAASASPVSAGTDFTLHVTLCNTSAKDAAINLLLGIDGEGNDVYAVERNSFYYKSVAPGATIDADLVMTAAPEAAPGAKKITLHAGYDGPGGTAYTEDQSITVEVVQPVRFEFDEADIPETVRAGETLSLPVNVMNLGRSKVLNVSARLKAPGFSSQTTLYLGNLDSGTAKKGNLTVFVGAKQKEGERYGKTSGTLEVACEDEFGTPYTQVQEFTTRIEAPDLSLPEEETEEEPEPNYQWQISVGIAGAVAAAVIAFWAWRRRKRRQEEAADEDF